jgi:uncharacterized protein
VFSWDAAKALSNLKKHGVSFEEASSVFRDPLAVDWEDPEHSQLEYRCKRVGLSQKGRLLIVAYAPRRTKNGKEIIRIISARHASQKECKVCSG